MSITEVAKAAGVSTATVSRVLNDLPGVRRETVEQVRAAAHALNYRPRGSRARSRAAAALSGNRSSTRTGNIAVITLCETCQWLQLPVMALVVAGMQRATTELGLRLILQDMPDPTKPLPLVEERRIDGAVVFVPGGLPEPAYESLLQSLSRKIPLVWAMGMPIAAGGVDHVTADNIRIGSLAFSYLQNAGCTELAYLTANPAWPFLRLRGQSFLNSAADAGLAASAFVVAEEQLLIDSYGKRVVAAPTLDGLIDQLLDHHPRITGLFVANDATVAPVYRLLGQHQVRIGQDLHIISCDNEEVRLASLHPRPATIDIGAEEVGYRSVLRLHGRLQRRVDPPLLIQTHPSLVMPPEN